MVATVADPFECASLTIPPRYTLIDEQVEPFIQQWRDLDARKIVASTRNKQQDEDDVDGDTEDEELGIEQQQVDRGVTKPIHHWTKTTRQE
jgi:hypothetical protein